MAKKIKPNLKDYLRTGKRTMADSTKKLASAAENSAFLDLLAPSDLKMWETMLSAGTKVLLLNLDVDSIREDFKDMDADRFTCYMLVKKGEPLRPVRFDAQIRHPLTLLLKWDETGILTIYEPSA